jgi:serine phosphatase RsbU (regulator of sigma subunit)
LLRNHVETLVEYFKKADSDSGVHRAFRKDLEGAKDVLRHSAARHQQALEVVERILAEVSNFANGEPQRDDVTLVVMKVQEEREV